MAGPSPSLIAFVCVLLMAKGALKVTLGSSPYSPVTLIASRLSDGLTEAADADGLALAAGEPEAGALGEALAAGSPSSPQAASSGRETATAVTSRVFRARLVRTERTGRSTGTGEPYPDRRKASGASQRQRLRQWPGSAGSGRGRAPHGGDQPIHPLVRRQERVLAEHGALGLVVELEVHPVDGVVVPTLLGGPDEVTAQLRPGGLGWHR